MESSQEFKSLQEKIQSALVATTKTANQVAAADLGFQRISNPNVAEQLDDTSTRLLALSSSLLKSAVKGSDVRAPDLSDGDDVDVHWSRIVDVVDTLLEKADTCLDEYTGLLKRKTAPTAEAGPQPKKTKYSALDESLRRADIPKPQNTFEVKPDNQDLSPWKPILSRKPHALVSLERSLATFQDENQNPQYGSHVSLQFEQADKNGRSGGESPLSSSARRKRRKKIKNEQMRNSSSSSRANGEYRYKHPYEAEILKLEYPKSVFQEKEPIPYQPVEGTSATFVDTYEGVLEMLEELKKAKEIAIDTEHHDWRTYTGLLSLMQISTREKDWIVDTLQPWRRKLEVLNEVFADPNILKVLHGAYMDIIWLQRDCGLYIVGLFDTFEASRSLQLPANSLSHLLKHFVDFDADKRYQLADWRIRPLPDEFFYYARSDTHYLLYVYDRMRNELLRKSEREKPGEDCISHVLNRSKETSLRRYEKYIYDAEGGSGPLGWFNMLVKQSAVTISKEQFAVFKALHAWRDETARRDDESALYIMSNSALWEIARRLPPDPKALHSLLDRNSPAHLKRAVTELFNIVEQARRESENGPSVAAVLKGASGDVGIGGVAQSVFPQLRNPDTRTALNMQDLVSETSRLWGKLAISSRWDLSAASNAKARGIEFALPWASFLEHASVSNEGSIKEPAAANSTTNNGKTEAELDEEVSNEFTLKTGRKRKAPEPERGPEMDFVSGGEDEDDHASEDETDASWRPGASDDSSFEEQDTASLGADKGAGKRKNARNEEANLANNANKIAAREAKKAARQAKRVAKQAARSAAKVGQADEEPFDYSKAPSVLNPQRAETNGNRTKGGQGKPKAFNPHANLSAEGPKPARRMHGEKPGKSATFKQ